MSFRTGDDFSKFRLSRVLGPIVKKKEKLVKKWRQWKTTADPEPRSKGVRKSLGLSKIRSLISRGSKNFSREKTDFERSRPRSNTLFGRVCQGKRQFSLSRKLGFEKQSRRESLDSHCQLALATIGKSEDKRGFVKFNKLIDRLKTSSDWKGVLTDAVTSLEESRLKEFLELTPKDMRGFDRIVLKDILFITKNILQPKIDEEQLSKLQALIDNLVTLELKVEDRNMTVLGGGAVNKVYLVAYKDSEGNEKKAVFKPDPSDLPFYIKIKEAKFGTAAASGIPPGAEGHLPSRAVASSKVDRLLFANHPISVKTEYVTVNGLRGILMETAGGKSPEAGVVIKEKIDFSGRDEVLAKILKQLDKQEDPRKLLRTIALSKGYEVVFRRGMQLIGYRRRVEVLDSMKSSTAAGLLKLQIKDFICGECDRHPENYFVDKEGSVTGIDEDCCFGVRALPEGDIRSQSPIPIVPGIVEIPNNASLMLRLPPVVTDEIYKQVKDLKDHSVLLKETLMEYLEPDEIEATIFRLNKLWEHMNSYSCIKVKDNEALLSPESTRRYDTNNSLLYRETRVYRKPGQKGWNHIRASRVI